MGQAAAEMPHHRLRELDKPRGDTATVHQFTSQHEKRDRHQREAVHAIIDIAIQECDIAFLSVQP